MPTCPCCSGRPYKRCCGPLLDGNSEAKTVKQLMRSRYSAYALGGHGDYLLETWHPHSANGLSAGFLSVKSPDWQGLRIVDFVQTGNEGMVEFEADFVAGDGGSGCHHEISRFVRLNGKWLYVDSQ